MAIRDTSSRRRPDLRGPVRTVEVAVDVEAGTPGAGGFGPQRPPVVLVVDDEAYIVDFVGILLEEEGYRVLRAYDGLQAWDLVRQHPPDLVITDVMMPRLNGLELLRRIRESSDLGQVPVILMSAVTRLERDRSTDVRFLPKPFDVERMLDLVSAELAAD